MLYIYPIHASISSNNTFSRSVSFSRDRPSLIPPRIFNSIDVNSHWSFIYLLYSYCLLVLYTLSHYQPDCIYSHTASAHAMFCIYIKPIYCVATRAYRSLIIHRVCIHVYTLLKIPPKSSRLVNLYKLLYTSKP